MWTYIYIWNIWRFIYRILIIWTSIQVCCRKVIRLIVFFFFNKCWVRVRFAIAENWFKPSKKRRWPYQDGYSTFLEEITLQIKYKNRTKSDTKNSWCSMFVTTCCFACFILCLFLYRPFVTVPLNLAPSSLFATLFLSTILQFVMNWKSSVHDTYIISMRRMIKILMKHVSMFIRLNVECIHQHIQ